ncbi:MAG: hypothetical protein OEN20_01915 [Gammaproteobacteria bacterium]|nr:hypothetical protein [Gammaproteobacteria bacterium]
MLGSTTEKDPVVFDSRFMPPFLALLALVVFGTVIVGVLRHGGELMLLLANSDYLLFLLGFIGVLMLYVLLLNCVSCVKVYDEGLSAVTLLMDRHFRPWNQLYGARIRNFLGLRVLLIDAEELKRPLIVPLYIHGLDIFVALIMQKVGKDHELARLLARV